MSSSAWSATVHMSCSKTIPSSKRRLDISTSSEGGTMVLFRETELRALGLQTSSRRQRSTAPARSSERLESWRSLAASSFFRTDVGTLNCSFASAIPDLRGWLTRWLRLVFGGASVEAAGCWAPIFAALGVFLIMSSGSFLILYECCHGLGCCGSCRELKKGLHSNDEGLRQRRA